MTLTARQSRLFLPPCLKGPSQSTANRPTAIACPSMSGAFFVYTGLNYCQVYSMRYLLLCLLALCLPTVAKSVPVYAYQLDYRLEASGAGDYQQLLKVLQRQGLDFSLAV